MSAENQTALLANYIIAEIPREPSRSEGAGDCAVRLLKAYRGAMVSAIKELGIPDESYLAPVANAYDILEAALTGKAMP